MPLWAFAGLLTAWRGVVALRMLYRYIYPPSTTATVKVEQEQAMEQSALSKPEED